MINFWKFFIILIYTNFLRLSALPINDYQELPCSAQDDVSLRIKRAAKSLTKYPIWPGATVPYYIDCPNFNKEEVNLIKMSLNEIEQKTCVNFFEIKVLGNVKNYIHLRCKDEDGCKAELGYQGRPQTLNLKVHRQSDGANGGGCMTKRKIQHEFMHALGFQHEHNSPVRDKYVQIMTKNIANGWDHYFRIDNAADYDSYGCPYDYNSVMEVDGYRHSKSDKLPTIVPLDKKFPIDKLGKADSISKCDIKRIRNIYCNGGGGNNSQGRG